jgi:hypothetical protein
LPNWEQSGDSCLAIWPGLLRLKQLRKVLGLESVKDAEGNIIQEAPLPVWANLRQRALDTAIAEITKKTDFKIAIKSLERSKHRRVTFVIFAIKAQARLRRWSRRLEKEEANGGKICLPNDSEEWMASIHCLAVEFDDVSVGVDDVNLRVARDGLGTELHLSEVIVGKIVAETFSAEPR